MPLLKREDATLYYEAVGEGPPLLLTHGFAATSRMWEEQRQALSNAYRVITWDMRGHGRTLASGEQTDFSREATVSDIRALLDELGHPDAVIGGHSLGGYMSLAFQHAHPERVRALVIIDTGPGYKNAAARAEWNEMALAMGSRLERRGLATLREMSKEMDPSEHISADGLVAAARGMLPQSDSDVILSLPTIHAPTLVIVGQKDRDYLGAADYMTAKIPGAHKVVIENAGHAVNLHQPQRFNQAVRGFLATLPSA